MKKRIFAALSAAVFLAACAALPPKEQAEEGRAGIAKKRLMQHEEGFIAKKGLADGYEVIFHIMRAPEGIGYSRDFYHVMVNIKKDGKPLDELQVHSEVKHPDGSVDAAAMTRLGDWYMGRYNLSHEQGRHWITVRFEVGGKPYVSGIYYPEVDYSGQAQ